jgi:xylan 1,4-beta-xylosidase
MAALLAACSSPPPPPPPVEKPAPAVARFDSFDYRGMDPVYETAKAGPGEYLNPVLPGYYPDPSILRVGEDYYLVNSSFAFFPGLPIFHSRDLVSWQQIGNAIARPSQVEFAKLAISRGLYAPALSFHDGTFFIVNTCVDCGGNFLITAKNPAGPWSDPVWLPFEGIDPSLFFDGDGKAYAVNNGPPEEKPLYNGHRAIWLQEFDAATQKMVGPRKVIVDGGTDIRKKPIWIEGPHLFRAKGFYYLICAEGGTSEQHSEVVFRSKQVWGPYKPYRGNPILTQRDLEARAFPVTSTGHAQLVATPKGGWYAIFLGTRPYAGDFYNTGRETFLLPVTWKNGWPVILPKGKAVPYVAKRPAPAAGVPESGNFSRHDGFEARELAPNWLFIRTPHERWYELDGKGLQIQARPEAIAGLGQPSFIGWRQQHGWAEAETRLTFAPKREGERAGLVAFQNGSFFFLGKVREKDGSKLCVAKRAGADEPENGVMLACVPAPEGPVNLKIAARGGAYDFYYGSKPGEWTALLRDADGSILSTRKAGGFVGTVIGMYAYSPE